jgi:hypothetical protein
MAFKPRGRPRRRFQEQEHLAHVPIRTCSGSSAARVRPRHEPPGPGPASIEPLKVAGVNDGRLALKTRIDFPYGTTLLIENLVNGLIASAIGPAGGGNIFTVAIRGALSALENAIADQLASTLIDKSEAKIKTLSADIMFTMRDGSFYALEGPSDRCDILSGSCDILVRPYIDLEDVSSTLTLVVATLVEGFIGRAYDFANPAYDSLAKLRCVAQTIWSALGHYLLGRRSRVVGTGDHAVLRRRLAAGRC